MMELHSVREKIVTLLNDVQYIDESVIRGERCHGDKCYAIAYIDLADDVVGRAGELYEFQERVLGDDFFRASSDLRWNKYLYILAGPNSLRHEGYEKAKAAIESDKEYARKRVVSEAELEAMLGVGQSFTPTNAGKDFNVVSEWERRLVSAGLDELLDRPTPRKDVIDRIGTRSAKRIPIADKTLALNPADAQLAQKRLRSISIDKFRTVHDGKSYEFGQVTLIVGANGSGKTSLLEAVEYFYCGHNRRQGNAESPKISGLLVGENLPLVASMEPGRIRGRCFNWYNRDERFAKSILSAFTRYNFLDTDAAFRISTELDASEIPSDLSRLLVGADASMIWDYLGKVLPDIETAYERSLIHIAEHELNLEVFEKDLDEARNRPSNGRAFTKAFHLALEDLKWKVAISTKPLAAEDDEKGLSEALGHLQSVLSAGSAAVSIHAVLARRKEVELALSKAAPLEAERAQHVQEINRLADVVTECESGFEILDQWLSYVSSGFAIVYARGMKAKTLVESIRSRLGLYATSEAPVIPQGYETVSLNLAAQEVQLEILDSIDQVTELENLADSFGKAAAARAHAARQLQAAAVASFDAGHPEDDCPICRAKYLPQKLLVLVDNITSSFEESVELREITSKLIEAQEHLDSCKEKANILERLQRMADSFGLALDVSCEFVCEELARLKLELVSAEEERNSARADWKLLAESDLTTQEHDLLRDVVAAILPSPDLVLDVEAIDKSRLRFRESADANRRLKANKTKLHNDLEKKLLNIISSVVVEGWHTQAQLNGGFDSLLVMRSEIDSINNRIDALQDLMELDEGASFFDLSAAVTGATRLHSEAMQAISSESLASESIPVLIERMETLDQKLKSEIARSDNYRRAIETLQSLRNECSLEHATRESLNSISSQINEVFGRIHAPNEYEYVGQDDVLLRASGSGEARTLEQISTGQRAAFALSVFLSMNRNASKAPPVLLIDDPVAHIDDLNALSFFDYLRDLVVNSDRQIFFATADTRIASLFTRKFSFLGESFQRIQLERGVEIG